MSDSFVVKFMLVLAMGILLTGCRDEGDSATLVAGTRQRFIPWWQVPLSHTMTIELGNTLHRDPGISLNVFGPQQADGTTGAQVTQTIVIPWACDVDYFFSPAPQRCPREAALTLAAAQQPFEGGRKVWRENPEVRDGLGWALAPESAFTTTWQCGHNESIGTRSYLRLADGRNGEIVGYYTGYGWWKYLAPGS